MIKTYNQIKKVFPTEGVTGDGRRQGATTCAPARSRPGSRTCAASCRRPIYPPGPDVTYSKDGTVAKIDVPTPGTGTDAASTDALDEIRNEIVPATIGRVSTERASTSPATPPRSVDFSDQLNSRLPLIFAFVFGLAFLLMLVTFRSIVIPIKAILLNLLSVGAAYGVLVLVFQNGHGESLLGFTSNGGVTSLAAAVPVRDPVRAVDGLPRVHPVPGAELHDRGMPTDEAVRAGDRDDRGHRHQRRGRDGRRVRGLRDPQLPRLQGARASGSAVAVLIDATIIRGGAAARVDEGARRLELVPAEVARVAAAAAGAEGAAPGAESRAEARAGLGARGRRVDGRQPDHPTPRRACTSLCAASRDNACASSLPTRCRVMSRDWWTWLTVCGAASAASP